MCQFLAIEETLQVFQTFGVTEISLQWQPLGNAIIIVFLLTILLTFKKTTARQTLKKTLKTLLSKAFRLWAHQDLNLGPPDYESGALTN